MSDKVSIPRGFLLLALVIVTILIAVLVAIRTYTRPRLETVTVHRGPITATVQVVGQVQPVREANLAFKVGGQVKEVKVRAGEVVESGQLLASLLADDLARQVQEAELNLAIRKSQRDALLLGPTAAEIEAARAALRKAIISLNAAQAAYDEIADQPDAATSAEAIQLEVAKQDYQIAKANFEKVVQGPSAAQRDALNKEVELAQLALERARSALVEAELRAPFAGTVLSIGIRPGEMVYGFNPVIRLADLSELQIVAYVDELDVALVAPGQKVSVRFDAFPEEELSGEVVSLAPAATTQRGSTVYEALVRLEEASLPLRVGMNADLTITTLAKENVLLLPSRAIQSVGRRKVVTVLRGDRREEVEVITGLSNQMSVEILSGLSEGDIVLLP